MDGKGGSEYPSAEKSRSDVSTEYSVTSVAALVAPITTTAIVSVLGFATQLQVAHAEKRRLALAALPPDVDYAGDWWEAHQSVETTPEGLHHAAVTVLGWLDESQERTAEARPTAWQRINPSQPRR